MVKVGTGRSCDSCTKCCEGWLTGTIKGHEMRPGKPCHYVAINEGCSIYSTRPKEPCRTFQCLWLTNDQVPYHLKPNKANVILVVRQLRNIKYLSVTPAGAPLDENTLSWAITYGMSEFGNVMWHTTNHQAYFCGTNEFVHAVNSDLLSSTTP